MGILGFFLAKALSAFMGADENIQSLSTEYMQIFAVFAPFTMLELLLWIIILEYAEKLFIVW